MMPKWLEFTMIKDQVNVPIILQFLILEFSIDGLRLAALNTPNMLSTPLSVIAALIIGDFAAASGWFNPEPMLYMAFVAISNYVQVSFELGYALKFMRLILLVLTAVFNVYGYIAGMVFIICCICSNKTISGKSYIYPLIPFNARQFARRIFRVNLRNVEK
jgi:stage V sporulation protein AF